MIRDSGDEPEQAGTPGRLRRSHGSVPSLCQSPKRFRPEKGNERMLVPDLIRIVDRSAFLGQPSIALPTGSFRNCRTELPPTDGPTLGTCLEPGFGSKRTITGKRGAMRSDLVYSAGRAIENRFLLATMVIRAVRVLHVNSTRTEDTANRALSDISEGRYASAVLPTLPPPPFIEPLLITPAA